VQFALDSSVTLSWAFEDEVNAYSVAVRESLDVASAMVATVWPMEVANALLVAERRSRVTPTEAVQFLNDLALLPIQVDLEAANRNPLHLMSMARTFRLTSYDAAYLDLALRLGLPLATLDQPLRAAARSAGVPLYLEDSDMTLEAE